MVNPIEFHQALAAWAFGSDVATLAVPNWVAPRLILQNHGIQQRWRDSAAFYPAITGRARLMKLFVRLAVASRPRVFDVPAAGENQACPPSARWMRWIPGLKHSAIFQSWNPGQSVWREIADGPGVFAGQPDRLDWQGFIAPLPMTPTRAVILAGAAADPKQKIIFRLNQAAGQAVGYIKLGIKPRACECIQREYEILDCLPKDCGPKLLHAGSLAGGHALLLSNVSGQMIPACLPIPSLVASFLERLSTGTTCTATAHPRLCWLAERCAACRAHILKLSRRRWAVVTQHGDCAPWNLFTDNGYVRAIDWEDGVVTGLEHLDAVYFIIQTAFFIRHWQAQRTVTYIQQYLATCGLTQQETDTLIGLGAMDAYYRNKDAGIPDDNDLQLYRLQIRKTIWMI